MMLNMVILALNTLIQKDKKFILDYFICVKPLLMNKCNTFLLHDYFSVLTWLLSIKLNEIYMHCSDAQQTVNKEKFNQKLF